jgi:hypothetical protein
MWVCIASQNMNRAILLVDCEFVMQGSEKKNEIKEGE